MTAVATWVYPGSRTLAGWWKQLAPLQPRALWVGYLLLHRVEALVRLSRRAQADPFLLFVLRALALTDTAETATSLDARLHLGAQLLRQILRQLETEGLAHAAGDGTYRPTTLAHQALRDGSYAHSSQERRTFYFVESEAPGAEPHFLNVMRPAATPWSAADGWGFEVSVLERCLDRPPDWKQRHQFPVEADALLKAGPGLPAPPWEQVILDRPERLAVALVLTASEGAEKLVGLAVQPEGWVLHAAEPVFTLGEGWQEILPSLADPQPPEAWRLAWRGWYQPRSIPAAEAENCPLELHDCSLRVTASARLLDRLRAARSDALKHEAWVLAGTGRLRSAALLDILEPGQPVTPPPAPGVSAP